MSERVARALEVIDRAFDRLSKIRGDYADNARADQLRARFARWQETTAASLGQTVSAEEGLRFSGHRSDEEGPDPVQQLLLDASACSSYLYALKESIVDAPESVITVPWESPSDAEALPATEAGTEAAARSVFIIHGHDETNLLRLQRMLRDHWGLETVVLRYTAGRGQTLIEKFEQQAREVTFAVALLTPDDLVGGDGKGYAQARPNVTFELGWFCGRLGRPRVCLMLRKGTELHSDLAGIIRIEFAESVEDKALELEAELRAAGLV